VLAHLLLAGNNTVMTYAYLFRDFAPRTRRWKSREMDGFP